MLFAVRFSPRDESANRANGLFKECRTAGPYVRLEAWVAPPRPRQGHGEAGKAPERAPAGSENGGGGCRRGVDDRAARGRAVQRTPAGFADGDWRRVFGRGRGAHRRPPAHQNGLEGRVGVEPPRRGECRGDTTRSTSPQGSLLMQRAKQRHYSTPMGAPLPLQRQALKVGAPATGAPRPLL